MSAPPMNLCLSLWGFFSITHPAQQPSLQVKVLSSSSAISGLPWVLPPQPPSLGIAALAKTLACCVVTGRCVSLTGHAPHHYKLVSVHVFIRHGDRYPLYAIPKTKRPEIDCTLVASR